MKKTKLKRPDLTKLLRRRGDPRRARGYRGAKKPVPFWGWLAAGLILFLLGYGLWHLCQWSPGFSASACKAAQRIAWLWSHVTRLVPFPLSELVIGALLFGIVIGLLRCLFRRNWMGALRVVCFTVFAACAAFFLFIALFGVQHTAPPLAERMGLEVRQYTAEELVEYVSYAVEQANAAAVQVPRTPEGDCDFGSFRAMAKRIAYEYRGLADRYPVFDRPMPSLVKRSVFGGRIMSYVNLAGYYFPWTAESVVSSDVVQTHIPFNIAHETAHGLGIGPEAECNFAAWLVCKNCTDPKIRYSSWICAYVYASNALYEIDVQQARTCSAGLSAEVRHDLDVLSASLARFKGPVHDAGTAANNALIQATGQPEGVRSYGRVVDLMLAYYFTNMQ